MAFKLWLTPEETSPYYGEPVQTIYRDIREGIFPFEYVRVGNRIKISARSIGLIPTIWGDKKPQNSKAQEGMEVVETAAPTRA
jgi:hypothetical protein